MRTRRALTSVAVVVIVTVLGAAAAVGATVSPGKYASAVCQAIADADAQTKTAADSLQGPAQTFKEQPNQANAIALRSALGDYFRQAGSTFSGVVDAARGAGVPRAKHGAAFAKAIISQMEKALSQIEPLVTQARNIDVSSAARFASTFQELLDRLQDLSKQAKQRARKESAFRNVPAALHPIVVYMTTDARTCPSSQTATA